MRMNDPLAACLLSHWRSARYSGWTRSTIASKLDNRPACVALALISSGVPYFSTISRNSEKARKWGRKSASLITSTWRGSRYKRRKRSERSVFPCISHHINLNQNPKKLTAHRGANRFRVREEAGINLIEAREQTQVAKVNCGLDNILHAKPGGFQDRLQVLQSLGSLFLNGGANHLLGGGMPWAHSSRKDKVTDSQSL